MKTHVIHLAAHDDYHSARDQMTWAKSARILLVLPKKGNILETRLDLVMLERQASDLGAQIALVTDDEIVSGNAEELKIPVFETIKEAQKQTWKTTRRRKVNTLEKKSFTRIHEKPDRSESRGFPGNKNSWVKIGIFTTGVVSVLFLLLFLIPSAEIEIYPEKMNQTMVFNIIPDTNLNEGNITGRVPARWVAVNVIENQIGVSTGSIVMGDTSSTGNVTLSNLTNSDVSIPEGTIFMTISEPVKRYKSTRPAKLQGEIGAEEVVPIQALSPGSNGNTASGTILAVEGEEGLKISVTNEENLIDGTDQINPTPSEADIQKIRPSLIDSLQNKAISNLRMEAGAGGLVLPGSLKLEKIINEKINPQIGVPSDNFQLEIEANYSGLVAEQEDIQGVAGKILDANLPGGFHPETNDIFIREIDPAGNDGNWKIHAQRILSADWEQGDIAQMAASLKVDQFIEKFSTYITSSRPPVVKIAPFSYGLMPFLPFRIHVREKP